MKNNPFSLTFGKEPSQMISRIAQTGEIIDNFTSDNPGQQIYMITGVRGSGKTVFMTSISKRLQSEDNWIIIELNSSGEMLKEFAAKLYNIKGMPRKYAADGINLSFWGIGVNIKKAEPITDMETAIERMLVHLIKEKKKILITIDEVYNNPDMKYFSGTLQLLIRHDYPVFVLMTGLYENINKLQNEKNLTFLYRAPKIYLSALNTYRIADCYEKITGVSKDTAATMARLTKGYSFAFQVFGYFTYKNGSFEKSMSEITQYLYEYVYEKLWLELSEKEKKMLEIMTEKNIRDVKSLRDIFNSGSNEFSIYRDRLIKKGILDGSRRGYLDFTLPFFEVYIREINDNYDLELSSKLSSLVREKPFYIDKKSDIAVIKASALRDIMSGYCLYTKKKKDKSVDYTLLADALDVETD
ncbi:MAG: ATP-binding protein [Lachnospiraceae bacterium]|nr:ATP-binding protein [Lachnospiraceae bacterium]